MFPNSHSGDKMNIKAAIFALIAYAIFSSHDVVVKFVSAEVSAFQIVFFSSLLSFPLLTMLMVRDATPGTLRPKHPVWTAMRSLSMSVIPACAFYAFSVLPLAQTYALLFATPLLITLLSIPVLGEKVGLPRMAAVLVGFIGVMIVLRPCRRPARRLWQRFPIGDPAQAEQCRAPGRIDAVSDADDRGGHGDGAALRLRPAGAD